MSKMVDDTYACKACGSKLEKGGEGSRGGTVVGHTASGKPIYGASGHPHSGTIKDMDNAMGHGNTYKGHPFLEGHKDWSKTDHEDAAKHLAEQDSKADRHLSRAHKQAAKGDHDKGAVMMHLERAIKNAVKKSEDPTDSLSDWIAKAEGTDEAEDTLSKAGYISKKRGASGKWEYSYAPDAGRHTNNGKRLKTDKYTGKKGLTAKQNHKTASDLAKKTSSQLTPNDPAEFHMQAHNRNEEARAAAVDVGDHASAAGHAKLRDQHARVLAEKASEKGDHASAANMHNAVGDKGKFMSANAKAASAKAESEGTSDSHSIAAAAHSVAASDAKASGDTGGAAYHEGKSAEHKGIVEKRTQKSMPEGGLEEWLAKSAIPGAEDFGTGSTGSALPQGVPTGLNSKAGPAEGGKLDGVGATSGASDSGPADTKSTSKCGDEGGKTEPFTPDDPQSIDKTKLTVGMVSMPGAPAAAFSAMGAGSEGAPMSKGIEDLDYMSGAPQVDREARQRYAASISQIQKSEPDVRMGFGVGGMRPAPMQDARKITVMMKGGALYTDASDQATVEYLEKSEFGYQGPPPSLFNGINASQGCQCGATFMKALSVCPSCGVDSVSSMSKSAAVQTEPVVSRGGGLSRPTQVHDIKAPGGLIIE